MSNKKQYSWLYAALHPIVKLAAFIFYRQLKITGLENIPKDKPIIFVANHQNALMDPLLCCVVAPEQLGYLARADVFKNPRVAKILYSIHMLPVYRPHDDVADRKGQNQQIFQKCFDKLRRGNSIALFPEGNHSNQRKLRLLRKGVARIALGAQEEAPLDLVVIPVGIHYSHFDKFRSKVLVDYGEAISVLDVVKDHDKDSPQAVNELMGRIREGISQRMINLEDGTLTQSVNQLAEIQIAQASNGYPRSVDVRLGFSLFKSVEEWMNSENEWQDYYNTWKEKASRWRPYLLARELYGKFNWGKMIFTGIIGAPFALLGTVLNGLPYGIVHFSTPLLIEDEQFKSSIKLLLGIVLFPLFWLLESWALSSWLEGWAWLLPPVALLLGMWSMYYVKQMEYLRRSVLWKRFKKSQPHEAQEALDAFQNLSERLHAVHTEG